MSEHIPDFTKAGYKDILINAISFKYEFIRFQDLSTIVNLNDRYCLMRHDIDISLKCALEMAVLEYELGIKSTYFFMVSSPAYNFFSRYAHEVITTIKSMGHEIGLHFDAAHPAVRNKNIITEVIKEVSLLSSILQEQIHAVSFHQPSAAILKGNLSIPGLVNTYHKEQMKDWYYSSDSNRIWKEHNALSVFNCQKYKRIQLLIHPIWWMCEEPVIEDAWDHAILDNFYIMQEQFLDTEAAYGSTRTFHINR